MIELEIRQRVVAEARTWIGTPYAHCQDVKGYGVDCGMILVRVFVDCGVIPRFDPRPYQHDFHLHRGEEFYRQFALDRGRRVATPQIGDVMLFRLGRCYSHGALVSRREPLTVVHAVMDYRRVVEEEIATAPQLVDRLASALFVDLIGAAA